MLTRRDILLTAGLLYPAPMVLSANAGSIQLGAQTNAWPVDPARIDSFLDVLKQIQSLGLAGFETGFRNFQSVTENLPAVRARIAATGLQFFGIHIFLLSYDRATHIAPEQLYRSVAVTGARLGAKYLILSGAPCHSAIELAAKSEALNRAGQFAKQSGLQLAYHNHWPEFEEGGREIQHLLSATDPAQVKFVLDAGHAFRAGADVPAFVAAHLGRLAALHLRDRQDGHEVPLGHGEFPLLQVMHVLRDANWKGWALLEEEREDGSKPGIHAIEPAVEALRRALFC